MSFASALSPYPPVCFDKSDGRFLGPSRQLGGQIKSLILLKLAAYSARRLRVGLALNSRLTANGAKVRALSRAQEFSKTRTALIRRA